MNESEKSGASSLVWVHICVGTSFQPVGTSFQPVGASFQLAHAFGSRRFKPARDQRMNSGHFH